MGSFCTIDIDTFHWTFLIFRLSSPSIRYKNTIRIYTKESDYIGVKVKVKFTVVQALRLCTGRTAPRGSRGIVLLFLDHGTRRG